MDPGHAAADARLRPHRFAGRPRRVDRREVPRLVRLRRRRGERVLAGPPARQHQPVLVHRRDRLLVLAVLRAHARAVADSARAASACRWATPRSRARSCARRARWPSAMLHRHPPLDRRCRAAATSRRWSSPRRWRGRSSSSSGRSGRARAEAGPRTHRAFAAAAGRGSGLSVAGRPPGAPPSRASARAGARAPPRRSRCGWRRPARPPSASRFIDSSNAVAAARHSRQGGEVGLPVLALGLGRQSLGGLRLERIEPAQGDVAADVGGLAGGRERRQLGPQAMVEGGAVVVDPRDDDAGEERSVRRRLGTAAHSVAVVVNELERLSHRVLVRADARLPQHHDPAARGRCHRCTDERCRLDGRPDARRRLRSGRMLPGEGLELVDAGVPAVEEAHLLVAVARRLVRMHDGGDVARALALVGHGDDRGERHPGRRRPPAAEQHRGEDDPRLRHHLEEGARVVAGAAVGPAA